MTQSSSTSSGEFVGTERAAARIAELAAKYDPEVVAPVRAEMNVDQAQAFHDQAHDGVEEGWINGGCWCCCPACDFDFDQVMENTKARASRE